MFHVIVALKRCLAWLRGGQLVWLEDRDGDQCLRTAYRWPDGLLRARRHKYLEDTRCILLENGTVMGYPAYVAKWHKF